ncbi:MAG: thiamine ABC transporter substrate-binding protein [Acidimicrobiia bacterium]|nr:thiamine ABC transporter substrate-binding protein [Acidimicrobiia bacterium]
MNSTTTPIRRGAAVALVALILGLTACSSSGSGDDVTLTLVTHDSFAVSEGLLDEFTEESGISVEILMAGDAGSALNQAVLTKDDPLGDVFFGVDNTFLTRALDEDIFEPYESTELEHVSDDLVVDDEHRVTPIDRGDVCLNYDKTAFEESGLGVPTTLDDLTGDAYAGALVVENPATSSPGLAFMLATIEAFGEDGWLDYWEALRSNDVEVADGWEDAYYGSFSAASDTGDRPLVVSYASSPAAEVFFAEGALDEAPTGVIADSCFRQIEFAGVLSGTDHPDEAGELIDFMLSKPFQEDIPLSMFVFPVRDDAELPAVFAENAELPPDAYEIAADEIGARRDEWIQAWTDTVLR